MAAIAARYMFKQTGPENASKPVFEAVSEAKYLFDKEITWSDVVIPDVVIPQT